MTIDTTKTYSATVKTTAGTFAIALNATAAPKTVNNFVFLAKKGYFNCNTFFRVIPGFVNQTGNPAGELPGRAPATPSRTRPAGGRPLATGSTRWAPWPWPTPASRTPAAASSSSSPGTQGEACRTPTPFRPGHFGDERRPDHRPAGFGSSGIPPDVTQRILSVTIHES